MRIEILLQTLLFVQSIFGISNVKNGCRRRAQ